MTDYEINVPGGVLSSLLSEKKRISRAGGGRTESNP